MSSLLLIDGLNLVRRVYEANPAPDSPEKAKQAAKNSVASFDRALNEVKPTHALAVFDYGGPTFRHRILSSYRSGRRPMPAELREVLPEIKERIHERCVLTMAVPDVEADDVIGSAVRQAETEGFDDIIPMTTDKDLYQMVGGKVRIRAHFESAYHDEQYVLTKFGVKPEQLLDYLALIGDSSDDVPGVAGIGPKTAVALLTEYGSLDNVLANVASIKGAAKAKLEKGRELALVSRDLIRLKEDIDLGVKLQDLSLL